MKAVIETADLGLSPTACVTANFPRGALHGQLQIGSQAFHIEAYQVVVDEFGVVEPVLEEYAPEVEALYALSGNSLSTQTIKGAEYVIAVFPHAN